MNKNPEHDTHGTDKDELFSFRDKGDGQLFAFVRDSGRGEDQAAVAWTPYPKSVGVAILLHSLCRAGVFGIKFHDVFAVYKLCFMSFENVKFYLKGNKIHRKILEDVYRDKF